MRTNDFQDTKPVGLYESAIGERNQNYYLSKFEDFDDKGTGFHASWNWAAFFFTAFWALYRKMYAWFFAWWAVGTVGTVLMKVPNSQIQQSVALGYIACFLGFAAYANTLYHRKVKKKIAVAQKSNSDASRVSKRLSATGGVNKWVPIVCGAVPVIGVVAAIALPAYQDYTNRQTVAAKPVQAPMPQVDWSQFTPVPTSKTALGERSQIDNFHDGAPKANQTGTWSGNPFHKFDSVNEIAARARQFHQLSEPRAWAAVLAWQQSNMQVDKSPASEALYHAVGTVLGGLRDNKGVCRPGQVEIVSAAQASESLPAGTWITLHECDR